MLTLFTDTDTDMSLKTATDLGYKLISMPYTIDGQLVHPYEDWTEFNDHEFYEKLRHGSLPTTSSISEEAYINYFEPEFKKGNDILYVHFSKSMSTTFNAMNSAVEKLLKKYPNCHFYPIDTQAITILTYNILLAVADLHAEGKTAEEIVAWAESAIYHYAVYFFADDLKFFAHSGRVSGLAGTMGTLIGIRPIIHIDDSGKMTNIDKVKGRSNAIDYLINKVLELGDHPENHPIIIGHADCPELADLIVTKLKQTLKADLDIRIVPVNPTAGCHCGPNTLGVSFYSKHR